MCKGSNFGRQSKYRGFTTSEDKFCARRIKICMSKIESIGVEK